MSRGLGKVERFILEVLTKRKEQRMNLLTLAGLFQFGLDWNDEPLSDITKSTYQSVARAVGSLERKGYIVTEKKSSSALD